MTSATSVPGGLGGVLPSSRLMGMYRWMGSHFHDWIDHYVSLCFIRVTRMASHNFRIWGGQKIQLFRDLKMEIFTPH